MINTILKWALLLASGGMLLLALTPRMQKWLDRHGFIPDQYTYGDLYNVSNLKAFKEKDFNENDALTEADKPRHYSDVHLYTIGDSFTKMDTSYYAGGRNIHVWIGGNSGVDVKLDKTKKNILVIQFIERVLQERLYYPEYKEIYMDEGITEPGQQMAQAQQPVEKNKLKEWIMARFGSEINQRLEFLLFNRWPFIQAKEAKAQLTLDVFGRVPGAGISQDKKHLFYELEVDTTFRLSAFRHLSDQRLDTLVTNLNTMRQHYLAMGFNEVYVCLIPNKVTIQNPTYGVYNHQIERIEANPRLKAPVISMIDTLRQHPNWYHLGDGHWDKNGKRFWLRRVNALVANWSDAH
ncbi:hypothetical protein GCM10028819_24230 [Spirosoma humi]